jgi:hypothetical protein
MMTGRQIAAGPAKQISGDVLEVRMVPGNLEMLGVKFRDGDGKEDQATFPVDGMITRADPYANCTCDGALVDVAGLFKWLGGHWPVRVTLTYFEHTYRNSQAAFVSIVPVPEQPKT